MPVRKVTSTSGSGLSVPVYSLAGRTTGTLFLPKEIFAAKVNQSLLNQAVRVYMSNQKSHHSNTKTRGEVQGSTRKIYSQKGTGRARHGSKRAPIFVGGGIALGPKSRQVRLDLPRKIRRAALISALSDKASQKAVIGLTGLDKASGKTKQMFQLFTKLQLKNPLIVADGRSENAHRAIRNIAGADLVAARELNAFEIIRHQILILTADAIKSLETKFAGQGGENASA